MKRCLPLIALALSACAHRNLVYHPWLWTSDGKESVGYYSDPNNCWRCDATENGLALGHRCPRFPANFDDYPECCTGNVADMQYEFPHTDYVKTDFGYISGRPLTSDECIHVNNTLDVRAYLNP